MIDATDVPRGEPMTDATQQHAEAVEAFAPETRQIAAGGKSYEVKRLETRQIWPTLRAGLPIIEGLATLVGTAGSPLGGDATRPGQSPDAKQGGALASFVGPEVARFLEIMAEHGERITEIIAIALDEKISTVGHFEPQETYLALKAIIEVNRDFFTTRVAPLLGLNQGEPGRSALAEAVQKVMQTPGGGETPSSN